jgi:hypothetical protein
MVKPFGQQGTGYGEARNALGRMERELEVGRITPKNAAEKANELQKIADTLAYHNQLEGVLTTVRSIQKRLAALLRGQRLQQQYGTL